MMTWLSEAAQDARYGARMLRRAPLTTTATIAILAIGLGLTAVVFSLVNAVLLRPLAAPDPDRLVWVATRDDQSPFPMAMVVGPDFADWKAHARTFDRMVACTIGDETVAASGAAAFRARIARVTDDFWSLSGARLEHGLADVVGLEIRSGRWLQTHEPAPVVVINEAVARRDFPGSNPIGRRIEVDEAGLRTIVGVVGDAPFTELGVPVAPEVFVPYTDGDLHRLGGLIRTDGDPRALAPTIRTIVSELDRSQSVNDLKMLEQALAESIRPRRFNTVLVVVLGATALALALLGVYAVVALGVAGRVREIGVRVAIGATRADIARLIVRQGAMAIAAGATVGLSATAVLTRWMENLLYEVSPLDPHVFLATGVLLVGAALLAAWIPARAAARLDPVDALRLE
jgi:cell division protein FtsX